MFERAFFENDVEFSVAPFAVADSLHGDAAQLFFAQRRQSKNAAAADQRFIHFKVGVFRCRADENDRSVFHPRQKRVLLCLVPAVDFVDKKNRTAVVEGFALLRLFNLFAQLFDSRKDGVEGGKRALRRIGNHLRQGGLSRAGRSVEDERTETVRLNHPP